MRIYKYYGLVAYVLCFSYIVCYNIHEKYI